MKVFVFVRGFDCQFKRYVVDQITTSLNPNVNTIRAIRISISDYTKSSDKNELKAGDKSCKNIVKRILGGSHEEQFIIIDNESIQPQHWQSYFSLAEGISQNSIGVGLDVTPLINMNGEVDLEKLNLQNQKVGVFKAMMYKYIEIKSEDDIRDGIESLLKMCK